MICSEFVRDLGRVETKTRPPKKCVENGVNEMLLNFHNNKPHESRKTKSLRWGHLMQTAQMALLVFKMTVPEELSKAHRAKCGLLLVLVVRVKVGLLFAFVSL
jgi:hypothetical protein